MAPEAVQYHGCHVASENDIYVLNILEAARYFDGEPIIQSDLHCFVQSIRMPAVSYKLLPLCVQFAEVKS